MKKLWPERGDDLPEARRPLDHLGIHKKIVHLVEIPRL